MCWKSVREHRGKVVNVKSLEHGEAHIDREKQENQSFELVLDDRPRF